MLPRPHFSPFVSPDPPALLAACLDGGATHLEQGPAGHLLHRDLKNARRMSSPRVLSSRPLSLCASEVTLKHLTLSWQFYLSWLAQHRRFFLCGGLVVS